MGPNTAARTASDRKGSQLVVSPNVRYCYEGKLYYRKEKRLQLIQYFNILEKEKSHKEQTGMKMNEMEI